MSFALKSLSSVCLIVFLCSCTSAPGKAGRATASLVPGASSCIDVRTAMFEPCPSKETRFFSQGSCKQSYEAEQTYCARQEMTNLKVVTGAVQVPYEPVAGWVQVFLYGTQEMVTAKEGSVRTCSHATVLIGEAKSAVEKQNPAQGEVGLEPVVLNFTCEK